MPSLLQPALARLAFRNSKSEARPSSWIVKHAPLVEENASKTTTACFLSAYFLYYVKNVYNPALV